LRFANVFAKRGRMTDGWRRSVEPTGESGYGYH
jgi:hypothetical protein